MASLQKLIDHPSTGDGEKAAAQNRLDNLRKKWNVKPSAPKPPPRDRTGGYNSTSGGFRMKADQDMWDFIQENFVRNGEKTRTEADAEKIERQRRQYEAWKKANDAMVKKMAADSAREAKQRAEREAAQKRWEERNRTRDAKGRPMTAAEREEAMRDPLGWAAKQDGRTDAQKNADMQFQYSHGWYKPGQPVDKCESPLSFYDQGGEPRKRNSEPTVCAECGVSLGAYEAAANDHGQFQCAEMVPGPRKKKPGRG